MPKTHRGGESPLFKIIKMNDYILYSDRKADRHIFLMREPDGKETLVTSDEVNLRNENYGSTMDLHHGLVRFMFDTVDSSNSDRTDDDNEKIDSVLRVPFDKFAELD